MIKNLLGWVLLLVVLAGCTDSAELDPSKLGYQYYPIEVGDYRIYYVTNIRTQFDKGDTTRFFLREVVKSTFVDQTNTLNYRIERSLRYNTRSQWVTDSVFLVSKSNTNVILTKDNTKRVKLIFPVKEGKTWPGDAYNNIVRENDADPKEPYTYFKVNHSFNIEEKHFIYNNTPTKYDSTVTVIQGDPKITDTVYDDRKEVYAAGIGMIYRLSNRAALCTDSYDGEKKCDNYILNGNERHEVLIEHGKL